MSKGKVVLGTLAGLAIGGVTGILFAPDKGSRTRKQIMDKGDDYINELQSKLHDLTESVSEKFERTKDHAESLAAHGQAKYQDVKKDAKSAASNSGHSTL